MKMKSLSFPSIALGRGLVAILAIALVAVLVPAPDATAGSAGDDCSLYQIAAGRSPVLHVVNGAGEFKIAKRGDRVRVWHGGDRVPPSRLSRVGSILRVQDQGGETVLMVGVFGGYGRDGQLAYSQELDPWSLLSRYGLTTNEPEDEVAELLDVDPRRAVAVNEICADRPAAAAGLRHSDVIVGIAGERATDADELVQRVAGASEGETVELTVERRGGPQRVAMVAGPVGAWPDVAALESHLLKVVNE